MTWSSRSGKGLGGLADLPGACPITWAVIGANAVTFLMVFAGAAGVWEGLVFDSAALVLRPWTALSYPLVATTGIVNLLLSAYMFWLFSGSLERSWGGRDYVVFLVLVTVTPAIALSVGTFLLGPSMRLAGLWLLVAATTVAWATINPYERLLLYFVVPLQARWLGLLAIVVLFFAFPFPFGVFALAGCGVAWWYAQGGKYRLWGLARGSGSGSGSHAHSRQVTLNPLELIQRWRRKRQVARLLKRSGFRNHDS